MNVYITYDRYGRDEWYSVYHIETNKQRAIKHFLEVDLLDFIGYGPDDCHSFQLQKVLMPRKDYLKLCKMVEDDAYSEHGELKNMMTNIFNESQEAGYEVENIFFTDGCSDNIEIINYYCEKNGIDKNDDDAVCEATELLMNNDEIYYKTAKKYIRETYCAEPYFFLYVTFDRYEHDEWFYLYNVSWDRQEAITHCMDEDLVSFISCGPDDCHSFQLVEVGVPNSLGLKLHRLFRKQESGTLNKKEEKEIEKFLKKVYHCEEFDEIETIISADGYSDFEEIVDFYIESGEYQADDEEDEDELRQNAQEALLEDEELFKGVLKDYIYANY